MAISSNTTGLRPGVCTSTSRPSSPYEGQMIYETDTDLTYVWGGSAWQQVSGGTAIGNSGLVTIASVPYSGSIFNISNCFTSAYRDYRITVTGQSNNGLAYGTLLQWTVGGVANATSNYFTNTIYSTSSAGPARAYSSFLTYGVMGTNANPSFSVVADVFAPQQAAYTSLVVQGNGFGSSSAEVGTYFGNFNAATQFDGFLLSSQGPTITGTVNVYGYRRV